MALKYQVIWYSSDDLLSIQKKGITLKNVAHAALYLQDEDMNLEYGVVCKSPTTEMVGGVTYYKHPGFGWYGQVVDSGNLAHGITKEAVKLGGLGWAKWVEPFKGRKTQYPYNCRGYVDHALAYLKYCRAVEFDSKPGQFGDPDSKE
jgi:hypothetical protein